MINATGEMVLPAMMPFSRRCQAVVWLCSDGELDILKISLDQLHDFLWDMEKTEGCPQEVVWKHSKGVRLR